MRDSKFELVRRHRPGEEKVSRKRKAVFLVFAFGLIATLCLYVGVYEEREWDEPRLFIKYRPSRKVFFCSPLGEATPSGVPGHEGYLTAEQQCEERLNVEFVEQNWLRRFQK